MELGLKAQAGEPLAAELDAAKRHIGELSMEIELLGERARAAEVATMSATNFATTARRYGLERVCRTWERWRSAHDLMWGTDGVRVFTADDGRVWTFAAVDHWNAECVGWHVCKVGNRFAALEPVAQGLRRHYGSVEA